MKKLLFIISICILLIGCSNSKVTSSNNNMSNSDPVTWLTIDGKKYFYTTT